MTPYYEDDLVTLYHGDCLDVLPLLDAGCSHLTIADPPYFRVVDADWDNEWPSTAGFLSWLAGVLVEMERVTHERGTLGVFCSPSMSAAVEMEVRNVAAVMNHIVWRKPGLGRLGRQDLGSLRRFFNASERLILAEKSLNPDGDALRFRGAANHAAARDAYADIREMLVEARDSAAMTNVDVDRLLNRNGMAGHYFSASQWALPTEDAWGVVAAEITRRGGSAPAWSILRSEFDARRREFDAHRSEVAARRREFLSDVWTFGETPRDQRFGHPTAKPPALMAHIIQTMSRVGDCVLDPFAGTGTTLRVAKDSGRISVGIERDERWCEVAARRVSQETLDLFAGGVTR